MMNYTTVLVQNNWGVHLNFEGYFSPRRVVSPAYTTSAARLAATRHSCMDADLRLVAHLYAGHALELLERLQNNDAWKTNGLVIGSSAFQLSNSNTDKPSPKMGGAWILENQGVRQFCSLQPEGQSLMRSAMSQLNLSARAYAQHNVIAS